jgi:hypothetical protein
MNWKTVFAASMGALSLSFLFMSPQFSSAAGEIGNVHSGNNIGHDGNKRASTDGVFSTDQMNSQRVDLHTAMVHVAEAESHLAQVRLRGNAHEVLNARGSLHESERYYMGLLATSSGVSVTVIEELQGSGVSLAQIGYDLQMVRHPSSRLYLNDHDLDMSGLTMGGDHSIHTDSDYGTISDHHGVVEDSNRSDSHRVIVSPTLYSRKTYPTNYSNQNSYNYHSSGGGMGGMH